MSHPAKAHQMEFKPILLKRLLAECDISQTVLAQATSASRSTINQACNKGYAPHTMPTFRPDVERYISHHPAALEWLQRNNMSMDQIWTDAGAELRMIMPAGKGLRSVAVRNQPLVYAQGEAPILCQEVEMLTQATREHFKPLFRDPFPTSGGIEKAADIYMSEEHMYIEAAILDAAKSGGFMAVIGDSGAGKTVIRKKCIEQLKRDGNINVICPDFINCERINSSSLLDAIIMDISSVKPKSKLEHKTRQVQQLLLERANEGTQSVLIIEEAHVLPWQTIRHLKRFYEMENGWKKLLGIVIMGQTELTTLLDENRHPELREVIRRIQVAKLNGLDANLYSYLELKFKRVGKKLSDVVDEEAINLLGRRLSMDNGRGKKISVAYPQVVNNYIVRAMNLACEMGEAKVSVEVVEAL